MGDDMSSHAYRRSFRNRTPLAEVLEATHPEIRSRGWSWVAVVDGIVSAVWSTDHGVRLLVENRRLQARRSPLPVVFRYFLQIDPQWLHERLAAGAAADREALSAEYAPLAAERLEQEQRRRERDVPQKLLSSACIEALERLGAKIDLHSDTRCRLDAHGERWIVVRSDTMTLVHHGENPGPIANLRPSSFAELWLTAAVGSRERERNALPRLPLPTPDQGPPLRPMTSWPPGRERWSATGDDGFVAQLSGEDAVAWYRFAFGRTLDEIVATVTGPARPAGTDG